MRSIQEPEPPKNYRSVIMTEPSQVPQEKKKAIDDNYYSAKASVFNRLGPIKPVSRENIPEYNKQGNGEPHHPAKRLSIDTSEGLYLDSAARKKSSIQVTHNPRDKDSWGKATTNQKCQTANPAAIYSSSSRSTTMRQTTDQPVATSFIGTTQPFRLVPILPLQQKQGRSNQVEGPIQEE